VKAFDALTLSAPSTWEDHTLYRYALPAAESGLRLRTAAPQGPGFRANVTVAKVQGPVSALFQQGNERQRAENQSFRVLATGTAVIGDKPSIWQDTSFSIARPALVLFQRQVGVESQDFVVLITLTTTTRDLAGPLIEMGVVFDAPDQTGTP
jgi:hypothetical protein